MRIERLRLKGFIGIKRGLGLDEIDVDFSNISGLSAFDGMNGAGKSTVLENLGPFNQLASRDGALHRHVCRRDAEKELFFSYQGHSYRTLLKIDCDSEKSEGYIWIDGKPAVNGKISSYAKHMKDLFGTPDLFYNSVFCSQNAKKLSEMTTGKLKELFSEFLRLDRLVEYENTAKQCANVMNGQASQVEARITALRERVKDKDELSASLALEENHLSLATEKKSILVNGMVDLRTRIDSLRELVAKNAATRQRKADVEAIIESLTKEMGKEKEAVEAEIESLKTKYRELNGELSKCDAVIADKDAITTAADREREVNEYIAAMAPESERLTYEISKRQETVHGLERTIQDLKQSAKDLDNDTILRVLGDVITETKNKIFTENQAIKDLNADRKTIDLTHKVDQLKEKIKGLDCRDPRCPDDCNTCLYITDALAAREAIPATEQELQARAEVIEKSKAGAKEKIVLFEAEVSKATSDRVDRVAYLDKEKARIAGEIARNERELKAEKGIIAQLNDGLSTSRQNIARSRFELTKLKDLAARQTELQVAISRKVDLDTRLAEVAEAGKTIRATWTKKETAKKAQIEEHARKVSEIEGEIDRTAETKLGGAVSELEGAEKQIPVLDADITKTRDKVSQIQGGLTRIAEAEKEIETVKDERDLLLRNAAEWAYLRNACSKNGLQALEIDGAAPIITGYANDLLGMAFGPLFTVKFRTQDEEGREVLDIVTIGEDGEEILLENLSGGQRIWILMALRLAMTLLSKEKSGRAYESFFADEIDGPLDPENSINFVNMYQAFMKIGGFKAGYFISHKPSCRALADNILKFESGKNPVWG